MLSFAYTKFRKDMLEQIVRDPSAGDLFEGNAGLLQIRQDEFLREPDFPSRLARPHQ
jgi:hypothetical protein